MNTLLDIPGDVWSVIFSFNFDLNSVKLLRQVSKKFNYLVMKYLERLVVEPISNNNNNNKSISIPLEFILRFNRLTYVSSDYPLYCEKIETFDHLSSLSLREARITFDNYAETRFYSLIEQFVKGYFSIKRKNYRITLFRRLGTVKLTLVDGGIILDDVCFADNFFQFAEHYPIYHYTGEMRLYILSYFRFMPHLKVVNVIIEDYSHLNWLSRLLLENTSIEEINLSRLAINKSRKYKSNYDRSGIKYALTEITRNYPGFSFPQIRKFLPIHCNDLALVEEIFPSLKEICFLNFPDSSLFPFLKERYHKISVYLGHNKKNEREICDITAMVK